MPLEHQSKAASSRLTIASLKWEFLNLSGGEQQVFGGKGNRTDSRDEIRSDLINSVPDGAVSNSRSCWDWCRLGVHHRLLGVDAPRLALWFNVAASRANRRRTSDPAVGSSRASRAGAFQHQL